MSGDRVGPSNIEMTYSVLVIGDDRETHSLLSRALAGPGCQVSAWSDCLGTAFPGDYIPFDLIIFGSLLPGTRDWDALRSIKQKSSIPIIALLDTPDCDVKVASLDQGADCCLAKPVDQAELQARIRALLRRHTAAGLSPPGSDAGRAHLDQAPSCFPTHLLPDDGAPIIQHRYQGESL